MSKTLYTQKVKDLEVNAKARAKLRRELREARGAVLADAEGFEVLVHAIESVGRWLVPSASSLARYAPALIHLVKSSLFWEAEDRRIRALEASLFLLRQTRNDYAHEGVHARNAAAEAIGVALLLEDSLGFSWSEVRLEDIMVRRPITAEPSETLGSIRRTMLSNSFSFVPVRLSDRWLLVSERWIADRIVGKTRRDRDSMLARLVSEFESELPVATVHADTVTTSDLCAPLPDLMLVAESELSKVLLGVVSPSDLL